MIRIVLVIAALASPLLFPFPATIVLALLASLAVPPIGIIVGAVVDALYYTSAASFIPLGLMTGLILTVIGILVRRFVKARIISA